MLGITVLTDYILCEGVNAVLDNLVSHTGVTAVACNPTVTVAAAEGVGSFQPPVDGGTSPRLFDRPLWGKRSLWVQAEPSYHPNPKLYEGSKYGPKRAGELTDRYGEVVRRFIDAAHKRGVQVYFQLPAAAPPGFTDEDTPRLADGTVYPNRFARTASVACEAVSAYNRAYVKDLLAVYPDIDGIRPDWPEYPCYTLGEAFHDFSSHAGEVAGEVRSGTAGAAVGDNAEEGDIAFETIRSSVLKIWTRLHGGLDDGCAHWLRDELGIRPPGSDPQSGAGRFTPFGRSAGDEVAAGVHRPASVDDGVAAWFRLKTDISVRNLTNWREALDDAGGTNVALAANAFAPPFSHLTGFDFARTATLCDAVSPKLYTMHWLVIIWLWAKELLETNPRLNEGACVTAIAEDLGLVPPGSELTLNDVRYPEPDKAHAVPDEPQMAAVEAAAAAARRRGEGDLVRGTGQHDNGASCAGAAVTPIVHGYGPARDFARRFACAAKTSADGVWVNRYGYLADEKLDAIGEIWRQRGRP